MKGTVKKAVTFPVLSLRYHGGTQVLIHIMNALVERGYLVQVVVPEDRIQPTIPLHPRIQFYRLPPVEPLTKPKLIPLLWTMARKMPPSDLLIANFFPTFYPVYYVSKREKIPMVYYVQDDERPFYPGFARLFASLTYRPSGVHYAFVSEFLRQRIGREGVVLPPGISNAFYPDPDPEWQAKKQGRKALLYIFRRKARLKGVPLFLQAMEMLKDRDDLILWILAEQREDLALSLPTLWLPFLPPEKLRKLYSSADLFVHTSLLEGFGLPPLEAMACGTPVVVTDSGGVRTYLQDGHNGRLVPPNPQAIAEAIAFVLDNPMQTQSWVQAGLHTAQRFRAQDRAHAFVDWLETLL